MDDGALLHSPEQQLTQDSEVGSASLRPAALGAQQQGLLMATQDPPCPRAHSYAEEVMPHDSCAHMTHVSIDAEDNLVPTSARGS